MQESLLSSLRLRSGSKNRREAWREEVKPHLKVYHERIKSNIRPLKRGNGSVETPAQKLKQALFLLKTARRPDHIVQLPRGAESSTVTHSAVTEPSLRREGRGRAAGSRAEEHISRCIVHWSGVASTEVSAPGSHNRTRNLSRLFKRLSLAPPISRTIRPAKNIASEREGALD